MFGMKSTREPIRGIMAEKMYKHIMRMEALEKQGKKPALRAPRRTKIRLVEVTNE